MNILSFILIILFILMERLFVKLEVKQNIDLFYALHQDEVERILNKYYKKI